jgi:hypothetical protein
LFKAAEPSGKNLPTKEQREHESLEKEFLKQEAKN